MLIINVNCHIQIKIKNSGCELLIKPYFQLIVSLLCASCKQLVNMHENSFLISIVE